MLEVVHRVQIAQPTTPLDQLPQKTGAQVAAEIGGRYLLRYLLPYQVGRYGAGSQATHYVTPTAYAPEETVSYLALPQPDQPRPYVFVLNPAAISFIWGPQWIRGSPGIQYVLLQGFPQNAIIVPGTPGGAWELSVR
jgi:hypothetical protein